MRTIVYVDGFNLYYRLLRARPGMKWLNPLALAGEVLGDKHDITQTRYFTARVTGRLDPTAPKRQHAYLKALSTVPGIQIHYGNFLATKTWAGLVPPDLDPSKPGARAPFMPWPAVVRVFKTEEKGSDVNLATHLLVDAYADIFDTAAVITNDTDLAEPLRHVAKVMGKPVGLLTPVAKPAHDLQRSVTFVRHIREQHLRAAQFPDRVTVAGEVAAERPPEWSSHPTPPSAPGSPSAPRAAAAGSGSL